MKKTIALSIALAVGAIFAATEEKTWPENYWDGVVGGMKAAATPTGTACGEAAMPAGGDVAKATTKDAALLDSCVSSFAESLTALADFNTNRPGMTILIR